MTLPVTDWQPTVSENERSKLPEDDIRYFVEWYVEVAYRDDLLAAMEDDWSFTHEDGSLVKRVDKQLYKLGSKLEWAGQDQLSYYINKYRADNYEWRVVAKTDWKLGDYNDG